MRPLIVAFAVAIVLAVAGGWLFGAVLQLPDISALITLPVILVMAYAVFRTRLFTATDEAIGMALQSMSEAVAIFDANGRSVYVNTRATEFGIEAEHLNMIQTQSGSATLRISGKTLACTRTPIMDKCGRILGTLLLGRDITDLEHRTAELEQERSQLAITV